jgi:6-phosphofructokinase
MALDMHDWLLSYESAVQTCEAFIQRIKKEQVKFKKDKFVSEKIKTLLASEQKRLKNLKQKVKEQKAVIRSNNK